MRSGVMARLQSRNRSVQSPSTFVTKLIGLGPRSRVAARNSSIASGVRHATHTRTFSATRDRRDMRSVGLLEVHPGVERGDLIGVAVEHQGLPSAELADSTLAGLAPARVIDIGIHV